MVDGQASAGDEGSEDVRAVRTKKNEMPAVLLRLDAEVDSSAASCSIFYETPATTIAFIGLLGRLPKQPYYPQRGAYGSQASAGPSAAGGYRARQAGVY